MIFEFVLCAEFRLTIGPREKRRSKTFWRNLISPGSRTLRRKLRNSLFLRFIGTSLIRFLRNSNLFLRNTEILDFPCEAFSEKLGDFQSFLPHEISREDEKLKNITNSEKIHFSMIYRKESNNKSLVWSNIRGNSNLFTENLNFRNDFCRQSS